MRYIKRAQKAAFEEVPPTCPTIADILDVLAEKYDISTEDVEMTRKLIERLATGKLRDALIGNLVHLFATQAELRALQKAIPALQIPKRPKR